MNITYNSKINIHNKDIPKRNIIWVWQELEAHGYLRDTANTFEDVKRSIENFIAQDQHTNSQYVSDLLRDSSNVLIPDEQLAWIDKKNYRQLRWIRRWFTVQQHQSNFNIAALASSTHETEIYQAFISYIDNWDKDLLFKKEQMTMLQSNWGAHLLLDKRYKWLDPNNSDQVTWAWEYIKLRLSRQPISFNSNGQPISVIGQPIDSYSPITPQERYACILSVFDCWIGPQSDSQLFFERLKKAWAQQKYRKELDGKTQCTIVLKEISKQKLNELAVRRNMKINEVIDRLIDKEYRNAKDLDGSED